MGDAKPGRVLKCRSEMIRRRLEAEVKTLTYNRHKYKFLDFLKKKSFHEDKVRKV